MSKEYNMLLGINELEILSEPVEEDIYIVDKILPPGVTLLCGHQKIGKSWLALKLCLCATRGVDLWGYKTKEPLINSAAHLAVPFPPCISCRFFDLPPVNLQNLQERLTENSLAS